MADAGTSETPRLVQNLARAIVAAARCRALYPREHPSTTASLERLCAAIAEASSQQPVTIGITPSALLTDEGVTLADGPAAEAAALLHDRDILRLVFAPDLSPEVVHDFVDLIAADPSDLRERGGPAEVWGHAARGGIAVTQVDYRKVLEDREIAAEPSRRDDLWEKIVRSVLDHRKVLDEAVQRRLLEIAGDSHAIHELARDVIAPNCTPDGSPLVMTQAAAIMAAFNHLHNIVAVLAPDRRAEILRNMASATARLDPRVVLQMVRGLEQLPVTRLDVDPTVAMMKGVIAAFDDMQVAQLLATTLALEGQASARLAAVFETIAPDEDRRRRVLRLTGSLLTKSEFGRQDRFSSVWHSMEELLMRYNERPFVSATYRSGLDQVAERATQMAGGELPPELSAWMETLDQDHVRRLSVTLLIDLLNLESDASRSASVATDLTAVAEDLLMAGDYELAADIAMAIAAQAGKRGAAGRDACRVALDQLGTGAAIREAVALLEDMDARPYAHFRRLATAIGPPIVEALRDVVTFEDGRMVRARTRASETIIAFGAAAVSRLTPLVAHPGWHVQRNACELIEAIGAAEGVPLVQPLLRSSDPRVVRQAVKALANIDDPAAARAVHTVLRAAAGDTRRAVVAALTSERDARVVPVLSRILAESDALGADHGVVLETLDALGTLGPIVTDPAIGTVAGLMRKRRWFARRKARALAETSVTALRRVGTPAAQQALADAALHGDRLLKRIAASH